MCQERQNCTDYQNLQFEITELKDHITERKSEQYCQLSQTLSNLSGSAKTYWTILKTFYSGKKIPLIPPLIIIDQLIPDFWEKANFFNLYFAKHCTPIDNDGSIAIETNCQCYATISTVDFEDQYILKIIQALDKTKPMAMATYLNYDKNFVILVL